MFQVGLERELFVPNVGLAFRSQATGGPSYGSWELIYAHVGKVTRETTPELSFTLALDNSVYTVDSMPPFSPSTAAPVMTARIRLRNTGQPITLIYPTGQTYELVIRDAKGSIVYRWSDGQAFPQIVRTEAFGPGEKDFPIRVRLVGADKYPLPQGRYTAEAWLTTTTITPTAAVAISGTKAFDASVTFEMRWVY